MANNYLFDNKKIPGARSPRIPVFESSKYFGSS